jgi:hypothetical protein
VVGVTLLLSFLFLICIFLCVIAYTMYVYTFHTTSSPYSNPNTKKTADIQYNFHVSFPNSMVKTDPGPQKILESFTKEKENLPTGSFPKEDLLLSRVLSMRQFQHQEHLPATAVTHSFRPSHSKKTLSRRMITEEPSPIEKHKRTKNKETIRRKNEEESRKLLGQIIEKHLTNQKMKLDEPAFRQFIQECCQEKVLEFPSFSPSSFDSNEQVLDAKQEQLLTNMITSKIGHWNIWNKLRLKRAIDTYKNKFPNWIQEYSHSNNK